MTAFGDKLRNLRLAQGLSLRELAANAEISPAYLSRVERGKDGPPSSAIIKVLARLLAADPDVLFRLASSADPEVIEFLNNKPAVTELVRLIQCAQLSDEDIHELICHVEKLVCAK